VTSKAYREGYDLIEWKPIRSSAPKPKRRGRAFYVISDIEPYRSVIDRSIISGRRQHRDHLRAHDCIEVGNEKLPAFKRKELPDVREDIRTAREMVSGGYRPRPPETYEG